MVCRRLAVIPAILFFSFAFAQPDNAKDSIVFQKADKAFSLAFKRSDSALLLANEALKEASDIKSDRAIANAFNAIGWTYMHKGHLDSAVVFLERSQQLFSTLKNENDIARVNINLAEVYTKQSRISSAMRLLLQADSLSTAVNNIRIQTNVRRQLAIVYREAGDYKKSAEYSNLAMEGFQKQGDYFKFVNTGISLSILYRNMKLYDSSLALLNRCLLIAEGRPDNDYQLAMLAEHLGETYFAKEKFDDAITHFTTAYKIFQKLNNKADLAFESFNIGRTLVKLSRFGEAEKYLQQSYSINDTLKMLNYQYDASRALAAMYEQTGDWQKAFHFLQKASQLKDSIAFAAEVEKTSELKEKFEAEKKETEITLLKTQNELTEADNRRVTLWQYIFILLFAASVIIGWLLLNRTRMKRKLQEQALRNQIAGDLHDDIGSVLSSIDISSRIALVKNDDPAVMTEQLTKIRQHARKTMDSMSDIVWSINPMNDSFESAVNRMREFAVELCEPQQIELDFEVPPEIEHVKLGPDTRKNIFLIFKEAVNNAVKYSGCTSLSVSFSKRSSDQLQMLIKDNGMGFDTGKEKKGNGLRNMNTRAVHLKGILSVESQAGKGTSILLSCPV